MAFKNTKRKSNLEKCGFSQYKIEPLEPRLMMDASVLS